MMTEIQRIGGEMVAKWLRNDHLTHAQVAIAYRYHQALKRRAEHFRKMLRIDGGKTKATHHSSEREHHISALMIKPVGDSCNLACTYCYEGLGKGRRAGKKMSSILLSRIVDEVAQLPGEKIDIIWHGGEPLLAGINFFEEAIAQFAAIDKSVSHKIQTNGSLVDDRWAEFFRLHRFEVGISLDGPDYLHDEARIDKRGNGTFATLKSSVRLLASHEVFCGAVVVARKAHVGRARDILAGLREVGIRSFDVHPACGDIAQENHSELSSADYALIVSELFDLLLYEGDTVTEIGTLSDIFSYFAKSSPQICYNAGKCASILTVESDGRMISCTRPFDSGKYSFGHVQASGFTGAFSSDGWRRFYREDTGLQQSLGACEWFGLCHGGCPQQRSSGDKQDVSGATPYCECLSGQPGGIVAIGKHIASRIREASIRCSPSQAP